MGKYVPRVFEAQKSPCQIRLSRKTKMRNNLPYLEIIYLEIGYMQNAVKIRKSILFGPECPNLDIWAQNLKNEN